MNYSMKVLADEAEYFHVKIFVPLPHTGNPPMLGPVEPATADAPL
jgi:hypothetical protein